MKARSEAPDWVQSMRTFLRGEIGPSWQLMERRGKTVSLGVRLDDGTRVYRNLPVFWERAQQSKIQELVLEVHELVIKKNVCSFEEAIERINKSNSEVPSATDRANPMLLLAAWEKYEHYKVKQKGDVSQANWNREYGGRINNEINPPRLKDKGKTYLRLKQIAKTATNSNELLIKIGDYEDKYKKPEPVKPLEPGSRSRQIRVQHIAAFLRWATSKKSGYLLKPENWSAPPRNAIDDYVGVKSAKKKKETSIPTVAIEDNDLMDLIGSLPIDIDNDKKKHRLRDRAMEWDFALKLAITYGLRPEEVRHEHLSIKKNGKEYLFCTYCKKSGGGITKPRRLWPLHPEWEEKWNLITRVKRRDPLPRMKAGAGDAFRNYLRFNKIWIKLKSDLGVVPYSFRHSYSKRAHQIYKLSDTEVAAFMGHSVPVHNSTYAQWSTESMLEGSMERAIRFRDLTNSSKSNS